MSAQNGAGRLPGPSTPPPPAQAAQHGLRERETAIPCEYRYLTGDPARVPLCPNTGTALYLAYEAPGLRIHFHLCGQHAYDSALAAFHGEVWAFKQGM